jgi:hypothetical protein
MDVLAALGNAPTAVIAVVAIVLGVVLVARGHRGEPAAGLGTAGEAGPSPAPVPVPITAAEPATDATGLQKMTVGEVGHGAIRLGSVGWQREPAAAAETPQVMPAAPEPEAVAAPEPEPAAVPAPQVPPAASGAVPFRQGTIKLRKPSGD